MRKSKKGVLITATATAILFASVLLTGCADKSTAETSSGSFTDTASEMEITPDFMTEHSAPPVVDPVSYASLKDSSDRITLYLTLNEACELENAEGEKLSRENRKSSGDMNIISENQEIDGPGLDIEINRTSKIMFTTSDYKCYFGSITGVFNFILSGESINSVFVDYEANKVTLCGESMKFKIYASGFKTDSFKIIAEADGMFSLEYGENGWTVSGADREFIIETEIPPYWDKKEQIITIPESGSVCIQEYLIER